MEQTPINDPPHRVTDLIELKRMGVEVTCQTFFEILPVDFKVTSLGETHHHERCLACYPADKEKEEKRQKIQIANCRLKLLYEEFEQASIKYEKKFFEKLK